MKNTAGGLMNTEYVHCPKPPPSRRASRPSGKRIFLGNAKYTLLVDAQDQLGHPVPLARLFLHQGNQPLASLAAEQ